MSEPFDNPADRRARPRTTVAIELKLHEPESRRLMMMSRTIDLSTHGAFVRTVRPLPIGSTITVAFNRGRQRNPLMIDAEVVRAGTTDCGRQEGIALRFKDLTEIDESLLADLIERHKS